MTLSLLSCCWSAAAQTEIAAPNSRTADFAAMGRYRQADAELISARRTVKVVFLGDSIMEYWGVRAGAWFTHAGWINRGIGGQTTAQLLLRERQDVLLLHPSAVVLEGAGNDMRLGFSPEEIRDNLRSMGELAESHHIRVFVAEMTPVCDCMRPLTGLRTVERISELNSLLAEMCHERHWGLLPINRPLADGDGRMRASLTIDGVHPNSAGYALLAPVIEQALRKYR
ncbi:GDSL-type esterase/lipase family protein [Bryocella elongata]|nr:GDSL-type esterase/lipase family protein [Bryocella elongata]